MQRLSYSLFIVPYFLFSCSASKQISKQANTILLEDTAISKGHTGISIYEPATGKYWYNYNADKYFIPCSNTKLFTLYAGMKYLGDSLVGMKYNIENDSAIDLYPTADPTFLHPDFEKQPVLDFLKRQQVIFINGEEPMEAYGKGWAWDDQQEIYMIPRNEFPMYGNLLSIYWTAEKDITTYPTYFVRNIRRTEPLINGFRVEKNFGTNKYILYNGDAGVKSIPFSSDAFTGIELLKDTLKKIGIYFNYLHRKVIPHPLKKIFTQPSDSLFKPMMRNSDNFFAEQTLLMASNERLGYMSDDDMIDTLLNNDLIDVPQKPKWVDGCGLSRYNLFTPRSFIYILEKMKNEFGLERLKNILPTGGEGTLKNYFKNDSGYIYAKTGTLSNNCALSGFLITQKNKLLIFSILANNYQTGPGPVRNAIEHFLLEIRKKY